MQLRKQVTTLLLMDLEVDRPLAPAGLTSPKHTEEKNTHFTVQKHGQKWKIPHVKNVKTRKCVTTVKIKKQSFLVEISRL